MRHEAIPGPGGFAPLLQAHDLAETIAFYEDVLGFRLISLAPAEEPRSCVLARGGARLAFFVDEHADPHRRRAFPLPGLLTLSVSGVEAVQARLARARGSAPGVDDALTDPNGYRLRLVEEAPAGPAASSATERLTNRR